VCILVLINSAILEHNLAVWRNTANVAKAFCTSFGRTLEASADTVWVEGLPAKRLGVVFLANGFPECVAMNSGIPAARIHVIPYGTDFHRFSPAPGGNRWQSGPLRLLFVGKGQRKGIKYLLDAVDRLPAGKVELTMCGRVEEPGLLRNRRQSIHVRGFVSDEELVNTYRAAHVFVLPSLAEGFGHVLLEAMACGLPIIGTTHTATPDLIADGQEGFIIEPADTDAVASRIDYFLRNPSRVQSMGDAARSRAENFTWSRFRAEVAEVVTKLLTDTRQNHDRQGVAN